MSCYLHTFTRASCSIALIAHLVSCSPPAGDEPLARPMVNPSPVNGKHLSGVDPERLTPPSRPGMRIQQVTNAVEQPIGLRLDELGAMQTVDSPAWFPSPMPDLWGSVQSAHLDHDAGGALEEYLEQFPLWQVNQYGLALLTVEDLFGTEENGYEDGLCEPFDVRWEFEDDVSGTLETYEGSLEVSGYASFAGPIEPLMFDLTHSCINSLAEHGGDIDASIGPGGCSLDEELAFFEEGSACRTCLESHDGDHAACVDSGDCAEEAQALSWVDYPSGETVFFEMWSSYIAACAPDWTLLSYLLSVRDDVEPMPDSFDHAAWTYLCLPFWNPQVGSAEWLCMGGDPGPEQPETLADGVPGWVNYIRKPGSDATPWRERVFYVSRIGFSNGAAMEHLWVGEGGAGGLSVPVGIPDTNGNGVEDLGDENFGWAYLGWGLNPTELRPDGTDPDDPDHTKARDWVAALTTKISTTINGIAIYFYNHNRCEPDGWEGPDARGRYRCASMGPPQSGWLEDGMNLWTDSNFEYVYTVPMATIASTGLPDPDVPGGVVIDVASSPAFANPDYEDCSYPHTFEPDQLQFNDVPDRYPENGGGALTGHTYRFGKDPDRDIRFVMHTNLWRGHCPEGGED